MGHMEEQDEGWNCWYTEAGQTIQPHVVPEVVGWVAPEEDQVDVDRHGKRPPRVRLHEPEAAVRGLADGNMNGTELTSQGGTPGSGTEPSRGRPKCQHSR
jgi:hypothetical protein